MFEIKVVPDMGKRFVMKVKPEDLDSILKELGWRMRNGLVSRFSVAVLYENVGE